MTVVQVKKHVPCLLNYFPNQSQANNKKDDGSMLTLIMLEVVGAVSRRSWTWGEAKMIWARQLKYINKDGM